MSHEGYRHSILRASNSGIVAAVFSLFVSPPSSGQRVHTSSVSAVGQVAKFCLLGTLAHVSAPGRRNTLRLTFETRYADIHVLLLVAIFE